MDGPGAALCSITHWDKNKMSNENRLNGNTGISGMIGINRMNKMIEKISIIRLKGMMEFECYQPTIFIWMICVWYVNGKGSIRGMKRTASKEGKTLNLLIWLVF